MSRLIGTATRSARFASLIALIVLGGGCGARTELDPGAASRALDGGPLDGGLLDAGSPRDSGRDAFAPEPPRDAGLDAAPDGGGDGGRDAGLGAACARDADCAVGACRRDVARAPEDLAPVPLVCGALTEAAGDGERCEEASDCDRGLCVLAGTCVAPCVDDADCSAGFACRPVYARTSLSAAQPLRGCVEPIVLRDGLRAETLPPTTVVGRGTLAPPALPATPTFHLFRVATPGAALQAERLTDDAGRVLYDLSTVFPGQPAPINPVLGFGSVFSLLVPNGSRVVGGNLQLEVVTFSDGRIDVEGTRIVGTAGASRTLDVDVFYVGGGMLRPERDGSVPVRLVRALREAERILAPSRVRFGELRQHEVPGALRGRYAFIDSGLDGAPGELQELFALGAGSGRGSLPLFLVRDVTGALGIAGDIPGAWMHPGEVTNGVAIAVDPLFDPDPTTPPVGRVIAHEAGHFLGLFHTSEADGTVVEPIDDTPACGPDRDTDGDGWLLPAECSGAGSQNFMFWAAGGDDSSPGQRAVLGRALLLR